MTASQPGSNINVNLNKSIIRNASAVPAGRSLISPTLQQSVARSSPIIAIHYPDDRNLPAKWRSSGTPMVVQKIIAVSKAPSTSTATSSAVGTITPPGTSLINPHIIQIHQTNQKTAQTLAGTPTKLPVGFCEVTTRKPTLSLTTAQQQNLLQSIKQRTQTSPQSLIIKQQQTLQQLQKQIQQPTTQIQLTTSTPKSACATMTVATTMATPTISSKMLANTETAGKIVTAAAKDRKRRIITGLIQQSNVTTMPFTTSPLTAVRTVSGKTIQQHNQQTSPNRTNVIWTQSTVSPTANVNNFVIGGQTVKLQSNFDAKRGNEKYSTDGRQMFYRCSTDVRQLYHTVNSPKADILKIGGRNIFNTTFKTMTIASTTATTTTIATTTATSTTATTTSATTTTTTATSTIVTQPVMRYKTTGSTSIRIMNASNLNIAHIGGKPVIIASKNPSTTIIGQPTNQKVQQNDQQTSPNRTNVIWTQGTASSTANVGNFVIGGQTVKLQSNFDQSVATTPGVQSTQNVMFGNQYMKLKGHQKLFVAGASNAITNVTDASNLLTATSTPSSGNSSQVVGVGAKVTVAATGLSSTQQVVLGSSNIKVCNFAIWLLIQ